MQVRDNECKAALAALGICCQSFNGEVLREPWTLLDHSAKGGMGAPYNTFDEFWKA
jgi:hypothetical protein